MHACTQDLRHAEACMVRQVVTVDTDITWSPLAHSARANTVWYANEWTQEIPTAKAYYTFSAQHNHG